MVNGGLSFDLHGGYTLGPRHALYLLNSSRLTEITSEVQAVILKGLESGI